MRKLLTPNGIWAILLMGSQLLLGCREPREAQPAPAPAPEIKLSQAVHSGGSSRTFFYQADGQLREIGGKGMYALSGRAESRSTVLYDTAGKPREITTRGESATDKTIYSYNAAGQLVRTEEYVFTPSVRRQMYHSVCNPSQDFDREREHTPFEVTYQVYTKTEDDGMQLKVIRLINPDNSFTEYFAR